MSDASTHNNARDEHVALTHAFERRCGELGLKPDPLLFWYHTIDLGDGLVTPGSFDYRALVEEFGFPPSMSGMKALDVGSATGFFAFELERRGAAVTSIELPALSRWDCFPGESTTGIIGKIRERLPYHSVLPHEEIIERFRTMSEEELYRILLDDPFRFCHERLGSNVRRVYSTVYELEAALYGRRFDVVMLGDILVHSINPLAALASAASVCVGELIVADHILGAEDEAPALRYIGGASAGSDQAEWWRPNVAWFRQILTRLGFRDIEIGAPFMGLVRPGGEILPKRVVHARR
jgi:tRNA (mo5U34)-methyltransferase